MIIWTLWLQGADRLPRLQARCIASWREKNPGWQVVILDRNTVRDWIDIDVDHLVALGATPQALSDIIRIRLLNHHGGVWVDATCLCLVPLATWLPSVWSGGFFAFNRPHPDRLVASWFLYSQPGHLIATTWSQRVDHVWTSGSPADCGDIFSHPAKTEPAHLRHAQPYPYFWFHYLFNDLVARDTAFRQAYQDMPKISAEIPHQAQALGLARVLSAARMQLLTEVNAPLFKLDSRLDPDEAAPGSLIRVLLEGR